MDGAAGGVDAVSLLVVEGVECSPPDLPAAPLPQASGKRFEVRRSSAENLSVKIARAFFKAATVLSGNDEDILPQEDGPEEKLSVYRLFAELFPDHVNNKEGGGSGAKGGLTRLQFNKLGYEVYAKEQSRRVPAPRAKPGNPGYGFKHARWRSPCFGKDSVEDSLVCQQVLKPYVPDMPRLKHIMRRIDDFRIMWDACRRPSHPAGPGRGRKTSSSVIAERKRAYEQVRPLHEARASLAFSHTDGRKSERCTAAQSCGGLVGLVSCADGTPLPLFPLSTEDHLPPIMDSLEREAQRQRCAQGADAAQPEAANRRSEGAGRGEPFGVAAKPFPGVLPFPGSHAKTQSFAPDQGTLAHDFLASTQVPLAAGLLLELREDKGGYGVQEARGAPVHAAALG